MRRANSQAVPAPASAVLVADSRLVARANPIAPPSTLDHTCAIATYNGVPGGCGMPSEWTAAISSPASQNVTLGASVAT